MSKVRPFKWFGSKIQPFEFINTRLPRTRLYCEPFGGAGTVLLNRRPSPVEVYNDIERDVVHFFEVLRTDDSLIESIRNTPYSREEFRKALEQRSVNYADVSDSERARLFFVLASQKRSQRPLDTTPSGWSYSRDRDEGASNQQRVDDLHYVKERFLNIQLESLDALDVMGRYDSGDSLFYLDPPYVHDTRGSSGEYTLELPKDDHRKLLKTAKQLDGYVAIFGYDHPLYDAMLPSWNEYRDTERSNNESKQGTNQELLWTNYDADALGGEQIGDWTEPSKKPIPPRFQ